MSSAYPSAYIKQVQWNLTSMVTKRTELNGEVNLLKKRPILCTNQLGLSKGDHNGEVTLLVR